MSRKSKLKKENHEIKSVTNDLEKSNIYLINLRERQNELNLKISSLNEMVNEKEKIIENLKEKYNQKISYYKLKIIEKKNRINNLMNNLIQMKYYVNEIEQLFGNRNTQNYTTRIKKRSSSMDYNTITMDNHYYNAGLINSLKNVVNKIDNEINESNKNEQETLNKI